MEETQIDQLERRVTELEVLLELRAEQVRQLGDVVLAQGREISALSVSLRSTREGFLSGPKGDSVPASEEPPPPHY